MNSALYVSALGLGLAGLPHCAAMCSAPCAALTGGRAAPLWAFHTARMAGYAIAGALAAASVNTLQALGTMSPLLRPLWTLVHLAALMLGLWLAIYGRQPAWLERLGRVPAASTTAGGWAPVQGPARAAAAGVLWVAWPCGLLQSAVLVAALADDAWGGASVMAVFALASAAGVSLAPYIWRRLAGQGARGWLATAGVRLAGVVLAAASVAAMGRGMWSRIAAYCGL